jgi:hypothetical protein
MFLHDCKAMFKAPYGSQSCSESKIVRSFSMFGVLNGVLFRTLMGPQLGSHAPACAVS